MDGVLYEMVNIFVEHNMMNTAQQQQQLQYNNTIYSEQKYPKRYRYGMYGDSDPRESSTSFMMLLFVIISYVSY